MSLPFKLYRLQQIDSLIDRCQARLSEIEIALIADEELRAVIDEETQSRAVLALAQKDLKKAEENSLDQRIKIENAESSLYSGRIRIPKELQDLQNEIASLKKYRSVLEDRQLDAMVAVEEAEAVHQASNKKLEEVQGKFNQIRSQLMGEQTGINRELEHHLSERVPANNALSDEERTLYEHLRRQRKGVAVTKVVNKSCSACGSTLNSTLLQAAQIPNQLTRCETCGRILYSG